MIEHSVSLIGYVVALKFAAIPNLKNKILMSTLAGLPFCICLTLTQPSAAELANIGRSGILINFEMPP